MIQSFILVSKHSKRVDDRKHLNNIDKHDFAPIQEDGITEKIEILRHNYLNVKNFNFIIKKLKPFSFK